MKHGPKPKLLSELHGQPLIWLEHLRLKQQLQKPPSDHTHQGEELMELSRMLLAIRHVLPKTAMADEDSPIRADDNNPQFRGFGHQSRARGRRDFRPWTSGTQAGPPKCWHKSQYQQTDHKDQRLLLKLTLPKPAYFLGTIEEDAKLEMRLD
ncbi:hypothetical protein Hte_003391 [Hypoxylon texense]